MTIQDVFAEAAELQKQLDKLEAKRAKAMENIDAEETALRDAASSAAKAILDAAETELA